MFEFLYVDFLKSLQPREKKWRNSRHETETFIFYCLHFGFGDRSIRGRGDDWDGKKEEEEEEEGEEGENEEDEEEDEEDKEEEDEEEQ